jgi:hypothetical protein
MAAWGLFIELGQPHSVLGQRNVSRLLRPFALRWICVLQESSLIKLPIRDFVPKALLRYQRLGS